LEPAESRAVLEKLVPMTTAELDAVMEHLHKPIALKQLLMVAEMARNEDGSLDPMRFFECIHTVLGVWFWEKEEEEEELLTKEEKKKKKGNWQRERIV
jgi:hypothetical protein